MQKLLYTKRIRFNPSLRLSLYRGNINNFRIEGYNIQYTIYNKHSFLEKIILSDIS